MYSAKKKKKIQALYELLVSRNMHLAYDYMNLLPAVVVCKNKTNKDTLILINDIDSCLLPTNEDNDTVACLLVNNLTLTKQMC